MSGARRGTTDQEAQVSLVNNIREHSDQQHGFELNEMAGGGDEGDGAMVLPSASGLDDSSTLACMSMPGDLGTEDGNDLSSNLGETGQAPKDLPQRPDPAHIVRRDGEPSSR